MGAARLPLLHAIDVIEVLKGERKHTEGTLDSMAGQAPGIRLDIVLAELGLPPARTSLIPRSTVTTPRWSPRVSPTLLHPSKAGFGMPLLEAQALGVPVITTRFGHGGLHAQVQRRLAARMDGARVPAAAAALGGGRRVAPAARGEPRIARRPPRGRRWRLGVVGLDRLLSSLVGLPGLAPEDEELDDGDDAGDAPPFAYDELYEGGAEAIKLLGSSKGREWILIRSAMYKVVDPVLANIMEGARKAAPALVNIVILQTQRADEASSAHQRPLAGRIDQQLTYFVRRAHARAHLGGPLQSGPQGAASVCRRLCLRSAPPWSRMARGR